MNTPVYRKRRRSQLESERKRLDRGEVRKLIQPREKFYIATDEQSPGFFDAMAPHEVTAAAGRTAPRARCRRLRGWMSLVSGRLA